MKSVINGKLFDTSKMTVIIYRDCYNCGNLIGTKKLMITKSGVLVIVQETMDPISMNENLEPVDRETAIAYISGWDVDDDAELALLTNNLVTEA